MPVDSQLKTSSHTQQPVDELHALRRLGPLADDALFRVLIDDAYTGILIHRNHSPLYVNSAWAELHGYSIAEVLAMHSVLPLIHPTDQDRMLHHYLTRMAGRDMHPECEYQIKHKRNKPVRVRHRAATVTWQDKSATLSAVRDISASADAEMPLTAAHRDIEAEIEQRTIEYQQANTSLICELEAHRHASEILTSSEYRFKEFAEIAADWFFETDKDLRFTYVSNSMESFFTLKGQRFIGSHYKDIVYAGIDSIDARETHLTAINLHRSFDIDYELTNHEEQRCVIAVKARAMHDDAGEFIGYRGVGRDMTTQHEMESQLVWQATHDDLTGLINRREFERVLTRSSIKCLMNDRALTLCYLDLDQFKVVNDSVGHAAGDQLLRNVTACLAAELEDGMVLARLGGDEFALLLEDYDIAAAVDVAKRLVDKVDELRFAWDNRPFSVGLSIGITQVAADNTLTDILSRADVACYTAKDFGRGRVHVYRESDDDIVQRHSAMKQASVIRTALEDERFELFAQPIIALGSVPESLSRYEVLLRLRDRQGDIVQPSEFIPPAERFGMIRRIDHWVIQESLRFLAGVDEPETTLNLAINLSGHTLAEDGLAKDIEGYFDKAGVDPCCVSFEITETAAIQRRESALSFIMRMRHLGCRFSLDDFGSGLSSFSYLRQFPIDNIKIDGGFVKNVMHSESDRSIIEAIVHIARAMGVKTTAEWVERSNVATTLRAIGVDFGQGFAFGTPAPIATVINASN